MWSYKYDNMGGYDYMTSAYSIRWNDKEVFCIDTGIPNIKPGSDFMAVLLPEGGQLAPRHLEKFEQDATSPEHEWLAKNIVSALNDEGVRWQDE